MQAILAILGFARRKMLLSCFTTMVLVQALSAQSPGLRGVVLDALSGQPVLDAYVFLQPSERIAASPKSTRVKEDGFFHFGNLPAGSYVLRVTRAGYRPLMISISLPATEERDVIVYLTEIVYETQPVVITGTHRHSRLQHPDELTSVIRGKHLDREMGLTLAATLKNEAALAMRSMGPAPARPVIRGLGGDRVFIGEDGNKTTDLSATSPDHAVTIDPFTAERIEVLRGPRLLTKTPTSIGGMVNVVKHEIPLDMHDNVLGMFGLYGESANNGYLTSLSAEAPMNPFLFRGEFSERSTDDLRTPEGRLANSHSQTTNYALGGSFIGNAGMAGVSFRRFLLDYGVPGGFVGAHPKGVNIELERRQNNLRSQWSLPGKYLRDITLNGGHSYYRHKEFEASGRIGSEFRIITVQGGVQLSHTAVGIVDEGLFGVNAEYRDVAMGGYVFTSPSTSINISPWVYEAFHIGNVNVEAALRYNFDRITPVRENPDARIGAILRREFHTWSASMSLLYPLTDIVQAGFTLSKSSRVPTIEELFSEGPHLAAYSYEVGNPSLGDEAGVGMEFVLLHRFPGLSFTMSLFRNSMQSFIIPRNTGEINYATFLPIYQTDGVAALMYGGEVQANWTPLRFLIFEVAAGYTHGQFSDTREALPHIPPFKGRIGITYKLGAWMAGLSVDGATRQERVDVHEEATAGYAVFNAHVQYSLVAGMQVHNLSVNVDNIFNKAYRNHLSRVKSILPEAGFNIRATYKLHFSL